MSTEQGQELPLVFDCEGESLIGIIHRPQQPATIGVITIIAGGPQYRGGVGRGMVSMARDLCASGIPVLRFDYRGMGDSGGDFGGFESIAADLQSAVDAFMQAVPEIEQVVLWGGCDAASGAMIHGWKIPQVVSLVLGNPWVYTPEIESAVRRQHYLSRITDASFWRKLLRFEYNILDYIAAAGRTLSARVLRLAAPQNTAEHDAADQLGSFVGRMLAGLQRFEGKVLFLISGQSVASREFDELVNSDAGWGGVCSRSGCERIDFPEADQTFSTQNDRELAGEAVRKWVEQLRQG